MKTQKFHGITSLALTSAAAIIGLVVMFMAGWLPGLAYLAVMIIVPQAILRTYCAKCPCKAHCGHVFPGKAAMAFAKEPGPYTPTEFAVLGLALVLLFGLPQFWLWSYPALFITFWILSGVAFFQIRLAICPSCNNVYCPVRVRSSRLQ